jgi:HlyD family secretion protein
MKRTISSWSVTISVALAFYFSVTLTYSQNPPRPDFRGLTPQQSAKLRQRVDDTVVERGEVQAAEVVELRNRIRGGSTVLFVVPSGTRVKKGDVVVSLDPAKLADLYAGQKVTVSKTVANIESAKAEFAAATIRVKQAVPLAEAKVNVAELALQRFTAPGGELEQQLVTADREIAIAKLRLQAAEFRLQVARQAQQGEMQTILEAGAREEAKINLDAASDARRLFTDHIKPHQTALLELEATVAKHQLIEEKASTDAAVQLANVNLEATKHVSENEVRKLEDLEKQLAACQVVAPRDGIVLHPVPQGRAVAAIEPGTTVRERQVLLTMPDLDQLRVRVNVPESKIERVKIGRTVKLRLDALPDSAMEGRVSHVSASPNPTSFFSPDAVTFAVDVTIVKATPGIRLGMTVIAEIDVSPTK